MPGALDPLPLLRALHERGIEHIVVGGFAVNAHGFIRVTKDLDIVPSPAEGNLEKLAEMLRDLDARIDVMQWLSGVDTDDLYGELNPDTVEGSVDGIPVRVCSLEHLRAMKRAAGRPQDLEDLRRLGEV
jgi:predicted nucleotidyltransferase